MSKETNMWSATKEPPSDIETLLNDTISSQDLEVSEISQIFFILHPMIKMTHNFTLLEI